MVLEQELKIILIIIGVNGVIMMIVHLLLLILRVMLKL